MERWSPTSILVWRMGLDHWNRGYLTNEKWSEIRLLPELVNWDSYGRYEPFKDDLAIEHIWTLWSQFEGWEGNQPGWAGKTLQKSQALAGETFNFISGTLGAMAVVLHFGTTFGEYWWMTLEVYNTTVPPLYSRIVVTCGYWNRSDMNKGLLTTRIGTY